MRELGRVAAFVLSLALAAYLIGVLLGVAAAGLHSALNLLT